MGAKVEAERETLTKLEERENVQKRELDSLKEQKGHCEDIIVSLRKEIEGLQQQLTDTYHEKAALEERSSEEKSLEEMQKQRCFGCPPDESGSYVALSPRN